MASAIVPLIIGLVICCSCSSSVSLVYAYPPPKKVEGEFEGFTQISEKRVPLSIQGDNKFGDSCNSEGTCYDKIEICKNICKTDFTCKGFAFWSDKDDNQFCYRYTSKPNAWNSISEKLVSKSGSKIFSVNT
jgi:hypothetical protein